MSPIQNIRNCIDQRNWDELHALLQRLSNAEFRRVERVVREEVLPTLSNDEFWATLLYLIIYRPQAFMTGILAIAHLAHDGTLRFDSPEAIRLSESVNEVQAQKLVSMAVPLLTTEQQFYDLFDLFHIHDNRQRVAMLLRVETPLVYFILFKTLLHAADHHALALQCCRYILKKGDDLSFNMASILREYFGLHEIRNQLSLRIEPYELSYIDQSFERFRYTLEGKRPTVTI